MKTKTLYNALKHVLPEIKIKDNKIVQLFEK